MSVRLTERQPEVLRWIGEGCPECRWPDDSRKFAACALASRGLVDVRRFKKIWTATLTSAGEYLIELGKTAAQPEPEVVSAADRTPRLKRGEHRADHPARRPGPCVKCGRGRGPPRFNKKMREVRGDLHAVKVVVTRVQVAERFVRATDEEDAASKVQAEFAKQYGYFGSWITTSSEVDVVEAEQTTVVGPVYLSKDGPLLLSLKDAAQALGISYSTLYTMTGQGDIERVSMGSRKYIAREALMDFIKRHLHEGFYRAR